MIITTAIGKNFKTAINLPRTVIHGEAPFGVLETVEENTKNANMDFENIKRSYGKYCHVFQKDENGKIIRETDYSKVENNNRCIEAMGF